MKFIAYILIPILSFSLIPEQPRLKSFEGSKLLECVSRIDEVSLANKFSICRLKLSK